MDKHGYDVYRQEIYDQFKTIMDRREQYANSGSLTAQALEYFIYELQGLADRFQADTAAVRADSTQPWISQGGKIEAAWIDPRFQDEYNLFQTVIENWTRDLQGMKAAAAPVAPSAPGAIPADTGSGWSVAPPVKLPGATVNITTTATLPEPPAIYLPSSGGGGEPVDEVATVDASFGASGVSPAVLIGGGLLLILALRR